jgi:hypothetical protein
MEKTSQETLYWIDFKNQLDRNEIVLTEPSEGGKQ